MLAWIPAIGSALLKIVKITGTISRINDLAREWMEAINSIKKLLNTLKDDGKHALKELDDALEKTADVCSQVPGLKKAEKTFRDMVKKEDYE